MVEKFRLNPIISSGPDGLSRWARDTVTKLNQFVSDYLTSPVLTASNVPATAASEGTEGQIEWDSDYIYICVAADTWKRAPIGTW